MATLREVDAVTLPVPDLDGGLAFYVEALGHTLSWRNDAIGQAGIALPDSDTEIVLTTQHGYEPNWLVDDVTVAAERFREAGGDVVAALGRERLSVDVLTGARWTPSPRTA